MALSAQEPPKNASQDTTVYEGTTVLSAPSLRIGPTNPGTSKCSAGSTVPSAVDGGGGTFTIPITAPSTVHWEAFALDSWITLTTANGRGNGNVAGVCGVNGGGDRTGHVQICKTSVPVVQIKIVPP
jgi:hypothetical protein